MVIEKIVPPLYKKQRYAFFSASLFMSLFLPISSSAQTVAINELLNMSLSELLSVEVKGVTLTETAEGKAPSTVTSISKQDIRQSGARSLNELLEMMVPNLQLIFHPAKARHLGLRGVNGTRDDKYLLVVDGRVMNEHTDVGVMTERDLPLFSDIRQIDVIRGPGSALYGPGALAMVISITTETGKTSAGLTSTQRIGSFEEFYSSEIKYGHVFSDGGSLFIYGGLSIYPGANPDISPLYYGATTEKNGITYESSDAVTQDIKPYNLAFGEDVKAKFQLKYQKGGLESGIRYSQGGEYIDLAKANEINTLFGQGYRQGLAFLRYKHLLNNNLSLKYDVHYSRIDVISEPEILAITEPETSGRFNNYREDKYFGKVTSNWHLNDAQQLAIAAAWSHEKYGLAPSGNKLPVKMYRMTGKMPEWSINMMSLLGEHQWNIDEEWTTFIGARLDKHTFTDYMFSPRATLIYSPNDSNTIKLMASRSVRTNTGADMKNEEIKGRGVSEVEVLDALELRNEYQLNKSLWFGGSLFLHGQELIGWGRTLTNGDGAPMLLGKINSWGLELESAYKLNALKISVSHSYTQMLKFNKTSGVISVEESAAPMGVGDDLANWFNHITKLRMSYSLTNKLSFNSTLIAYWYNPGGEDYANWLKSEDASTYDVNQTKAFEPSYFLSVGGEYRYSDSFNIRLDSYNILGLLDENFNTSRYGYNNSRPGMYRVRPEAIALQLAYTF